MCALLIALMLVATLLVLPGGCSSQQPVTTTPLPVVHTTPPPPTTVPTTVAVTTTVAPVATKEYTSFHNTTAGYSLDYPSSWKVDGFSGTGTIFSDSTGSSTINITFQPGVYEKIFETFSASHSEMKLDFMNGLAGSWRYSLFSKPAGTKIKKTYLCDLNPYLLIIDFSFQNDSGAEAYFNKLNSNILHMITSFKSDTIVVASSTSPTPPPASTAPAPTSPPASTTPPVYKDEVDPEGRYKTSFIGLVKTTDGIITGSGCYDDKGKYIVLINNKSALDPTYRQLFDFLKGDKTDQYLYKYKALTPSTDQAAESRVNLDRIKNIIDTKQKPDPSQTYADFTERLHNNAEIAGIKCGFVVLKIQDNPDPYKYGITSGLGYTCCAFKTSDKGMIYIDVTGMPPSQKHPERTTTQVDLVEGKEYVRVSLFTEDNWNNIWKSQGTVTGFETIWDGIWTQ